MKLYNVILTGFLSGIAGAYALRVAAPADGPDRVAYPAATQSPIKPYRASSVSPSPKVEYKDVDLVDFSPAAKRAIPSVVYIKSISQKGVSHSYWDMLFSNTPQKTVSSGSGVIFRKEGYIVTNNHVVESAEKIEVLYRKKTYPATLVGVDPSTDLAVLKVAADRLPAMPLGSSQDLQVGEWVIAVGNPFSLSSTVTAGIVSAKGRRINVVEDRFPIESFIQTDAAINPGNSGGALVNTNGELVGINTAILSRTGSYTGYSFAVPVDIVKKIVADIIEYGMAQKPFFGAKVEEYDADIVAKYNLDVREEAFSGVLITEMEKQGAAYRSGLRPGDVLIRFDDASINGKGEFEEALSYRSPGDKIAVTYLRDGNAETATVTLVNRDGNTDLILRRLYEDPTTGAVLEAVEYGVKVVKIKEGLFKRLNLPENYIILSLNGQTVKDPQTVIRFFAKYRGRVSMYGITGSNRRLPVVFYLK